jgi:hypothetical protein
MAESWIASLKAGDKVFVAHSQSWTENFTEAVVERVTPSGRIIALGYTFNPDGWERGASVRAAHVLHRWSEDAARSYQEQRDHRARVNRMAHQVKWHEVAPAKLREIAAILDREDKGGGSDG